MGEHTTSGDMQGCVCASLPDKAAMEALLLGLDDIARIRETTREEVLGGLALNEVLKIWEERLNRGEIPLQRGSMLENTLAGLRYASLVDAGTCFRPLAEGVFILLKSNLARIRTDLTDGETAEPERLKSLSSLGVDANAVGLHDTLLPDLALRILERWGEDDDWATAYADLATVVRLTEPWDENETDRYFVCDAIGWSWENHCDELL